jgi:hypothetical protein
VLLLLLRLLTGLRGDVVIKLSGRWDQALLWRQRLVPAGALLDPGFGMEVDLVWVRLEMTRTKVEPT